MDLTSAVSESLEGSCTTSLQKIMSSIDAPKVAAVAAADDAITSEDFIDPWNVKAADGSGGIDYNKLIQNFGSSPIDKVFPFSSESLLLRFT